jgi:hypothetical protein
MTKGSVGVAAWLLALGLAGVGSAQEPPALAPPGLAVKGVELFPAPEVPLAPVPPMLPSVVIIKEPPPPPPPKPPLSGGVEFGVTGAEGNSENFKVRLGGNVKYETSAELFKGEFVYNYATASGQVNENRFLGNARHEWKWLQTPWSWFVSGSAEYDEFKQFDVRLAAHTGFGYEFVKTPATSLKGRLGAGGSQEINSPHNDFVPEVLVGLDVEHKFSDRQKVTLSAEGFPDVDNVSHYRVQAKGAFEILVDPAWNLTLKLGAQDRYDSSPQSANPTKPVKRNDVEYFAVLLWKF